MENHFVKVTDTKAFGELADRSKERPVLVEVQRARELSAEIENRLGVNHESPQVIVLRNGQVVWNASHYKITAEAVARAVHDSEVGSPGSTGKAPALPGEA